MSITTIEREETREETKAPKRLVLNKETLRDLRQNGPVKADHDITGSAVTNLIPPGWPCISHCCSPTPFGTCAC